jgi:hypothetical protein
MLILQAEGLPEHAVNRHPLVQADLKSALSLHRALDASEGGDANLRSLMDSYRHPVLGTWRHFGASDAARSEIDFVTVE